MPEGGLQMTRLLEADPDDVARSPFPVLVPLILLLVAIGGAIDLALDQPASWLSLHVLVEVTLMVVSLTFSIVLWRAWHRTSQQLVRAKQAIAASAAERDTWRKSAESALAGFSRAVEKQFAKWGLTPVEREIALLLLKGHGHKLVAAQTGRSERTVRQHAVSVYEKSGLGGRAELAAFFLEGLMLPVRENPESLTEADGG
jgi:DNA-binding CsgD family transcriptional regulator